MEIKEAKEAIDKAFDFVLEKERYVPSVRIEPRRVWASAVPAFERNQITGYEFEMGDITFRIIRRSSRLRCRMGGWLIEKVGDLPRGMLVDKFPRILQTMLWFEILTGLHCERSSPVRVTFNVWQRRPC
jgi:hypothetical protein